MLLLNFAHPVTPAQRARIEELAGQPVERVIDVPAQFDPARPYAAQTSELIAAAGLAPAGWQMLPLLVNLPSYNVIAALMIAELHGRMGYFPAILRLRPVAGSTPPQFEVAEIINLQAIRDAARTRR